jgi:Putative MetA-pathway of phenol degradation
MCFHRETLARARLTLAILVAARWACAQTVPAGERTEGPPPIQDNSFLMEEAYNQEEGVVQHINAFLRMRGGEWIATFTQEWPVPGQTHQLSYTIPYQRATDDSRSRSGLGDVAVNYRYQLAGSGETRFACTPRLTLLLPTGDEKRGLGSGGVGFQVNVALSNVLSPQFVAHTNVGGTYTGAAKDSRGDRAVARGVNAGQSLIWTLRRDFNVMFEAVWTRSQTVVAPGRTDRQDTFFLSPGIRWAWNFASGLQIVPGIAAPIGVGPSRHDRGVFVYLSFEHPMWRARSK